MTLRAGTNEHSLNIALLSKCTSETSFSELPCNITYFNVNIDLLLSACVSLHNLETFKLDRNWDGEGVKE